MLKKVTTTSLPLIIYNPAGVFSADYFSHCAKAGALPVFDTEMFSDDDVLHHIDELSESDFLFGIRVSAGREKILNNLENRFVPNCDAVVICYNNTDELKNYSAGKSRYTIIVEVTDIEINSLVDAVAPNALILRGFEAPGKVSKYTSFVMLQWYAENTDYPFFIHGGVGYFSAAGMFAAGASGVVLDDQLYLAEEAPVSEKIRSLLMKLEESDSNTVTDGSGVKRRFFAKLATKIVRDLKKKSGSGIYDDNPASLYDEIKSLYSPVNGNDGEPTQKLFYLGQDAILAKYFVRDTKKTGEIIQNFFKRINDELSYIEKSDPMVEGSLLAADHGTKYPIVQGPMANISDNMEFARLVLDGGALPFFAVGSLPPDIAEKLVSGGKEGMKIFGAGMIGVPAFNRYLSEHMEIVKKHVAPFALFAAGNPSQIKELETAGTKAYLHTPSMSMLSNAISAGCSRFIFEGTEAGGHIGNLSSMVLWELALETVNSLPDEAVKGLRLLFAGGIGTPRASHFISGMTSSTAGKGCGIGVQVSTAYLFTKEILETGALTKVYQDVMFREHGTMVIGETVGLMARTVASPFSKRIQENEIHRLVDNIPLHERKELFELDNTGSLLVGAKGYHLDFSDPEKVRYVNVSENEQYEKGNFMAGDILSCEYGQITIAEIHDRIINRKDMMSRNLDRIEIVFGDSGTIRDEIAVIGMGCVYPDASSPDELWENVISKRYSISDMPDSRLRPFYYDRDKKAEDKTYTKIAATLKEYKFDNKRFGYSDEESESISRSQGMILEAAMDAVEDAGYMSEGKKLPRKRTAVIIASCLTNEMNSDLHFKYYYPEILSYLDKIEEYRSLNDKEKQLLKDNLKAGLAHGHVNEDMDGAAVHMESVRVAQHLGLEGINYTIDAACASSLAAIDAGRKELLSGMHDAVVVGGVNTNLSPESFVGFCKMGALSAEGSFPFDERANGFVLGEGAGVVILKRMKDALRDGDKIYAVLKGIGSSSDGKGKAIAAPNPEGQEYAINRCYKSLYSDIKKSELDYIEAHGTSTLMGDLAEIETLKKIYGADSAHIGLSSIKSQIGHLLGGAGMAGLIKAIQAINRKTLPPNGLFEKLSPRFDLSGSGLYIIKDAVPWEAKNGKARMAAVSSFGFGGINFHCIISEMTGSYVPVRRSELFSPDVNSNDRRIVITGIGIMLPGINNAGDYWNVLDSGKELLRDIPGTRFHNKYYTSENDENYRLPELKAGVFEESSIDGKKYRMPPAIVRSVDRAQFIGLECTRQALEQSGMPDKLQKGNNLAVIIGTTSGDKMLENILRTRIPLLQDIISGIKLTDRSGQAAIIEKLTAALKERFHINNEDTVPGMLSNIVSGRIANFYGCNGANFTIDADGASSAVAMRLAYLGIRSGDFESVITGGIDSSITPGWFQRLKRSGMLSDGTAEIFDKDKHGINLSEGGALFILTSHKNAVKNGMPVLAELESIGLNSDPDSRKDGNPGSSFSGAIGKAYEASTLSGRQVGYIDVQGSGTAAFSESEYKSLNSTYRTGAMFGNSIPQIGYYKSANPAVSIAKLVMMNVKGRIPAVKGYRGESSIVSADSLIRPADSAVEMPDTPRYFASDIFSSSGLHGHAVIGTLPASLSIDSKKAEEVQKPVLNVIRAAAPNANYTGVRGSVVTALFSGQGAQHAGMMNELYRAEPLIRETMDKGEAIFRAERGYSLLDLMFGSSAEINSTENTQPAVFLSSAAIYDALSPAGFNPRYFIGHSLGEISALYCSGILDFDQAMKLVLKRSSLMKESSEKVPGEIMVVFSTWRDTAALINSTKIKDLFVTNKNSDTQTVVAGSPAAIAEFIPHLKSGNIIFKKLPLSGAFHTPLFSSASEGMRKYLAGVKFADKDYTRVISNVTGRPYPQNENEIRELLSKQVISPVEFIGSVEYVHSNGASSFVEIGPAGILTNLLKNINVKAAFSAATVDQKKGETASFSEVSRLLKKEDPIIKDSVMTVKKPSPAQDLKSVKQPEHQSKSIDSSVIGDEGFKNFLNERKSDVERILYDEYRKYSLMKDLEEREKFDFYTGSVVISGVSVGLPGKSRKVFEDDNIESILKGENRIELIGDEFLERQIDKNIIKLNKKPDGSATMQEITSDDEVIHLAGQLGYFNRLDYGIEFDNDKADALAMAAGIEALRDAGIPLVPLRKKTSTGSYLFNGYALPEEMQETTGVIRTSVFAGFDSIIEEVARYTTYLNINGPYKLFEKIYYYLMEKIQDEDTKRSLTEWFFSLKKQGTEGEYVFNRNFILKMGYMGAPQFAQLIKAKGPNTQSNAACASVTQAIGMAEDWIRTGRCERVIVIGSEVTDSERLGQWLHAGFLAMGAATIKKNVFDAAKPFDAERNGTIIGSGASAVVVERADFVHKRGRAGQAEILGTVTGNSAFHGTRIDVSHIVQVMKKMVERAERRFNLVKSEYTKSMIFMSHETFTPAVGGSAQAEIDAIKASYPEDYRNILITNTKGFTGHTLGGGLEDPVMIKALQLGMAPPIANLSRVPSEFSDLNFSKGARGTYNYGLHFAAGFGSHFALLFTRRIEETSLENPVYQEWLRNISGYQNPELTLINKTLCIRAQEHVVSRTAPALTAVADRKPAPEKPAVKAQTTAAPAVPVQAPAKNNLSSVKDEIKKVIAAQTGYTVDMLDDGLDLEADLGIDTVKQVEIFGKISAHFSLEVPEDLKLSNMNTIQKLVEYIGSKVKIQSAPASASEVKSAAAAASAPAAGSSQDIASIINIIKGVIAAQTGYTVDMLDDGLDLEADLGIDTVKQVEIFGKISAQFSLEVPEDLKLSDMNTIEKLVKYISSKVKVSAAPAASVQPAPAASTGGTDLTDIKNRIKDVIANQTGYTVDMLDDGLDLEADLGIDTVKQVEIFGKISAQFSLEVPEDLKLSDMNTIEKLVHYIASKVKTSAADISVPAVTETPAPAQTVNIDGIHRYTLSVTQLPEIRKGNSNLNGKTFLISRDNLGYTDRIAEQIKSDGGNVLTIGSTGASDCVVDLTDPSAVEKTLSEFSKNHPEINCFIHLSPIDYAVAGTHTSAKCIESSIKSFFIILKTLNESLRSKNSIIASLSFNSVVFPYGENCGEIYPVFGGVAGMLKTVNKEFTDAVVKAVDISTDTPKKGIDETVTLFINELLSGDRRVEVGYRGGSRYGIILADEAPQHGFSVLKNESTVLVTGGAGGITFEILKRFAKDYRDLKLIIFDITDIESVKDEFLPESVNEDFVISSLKKSMQGAKPLEIKQAAGHIMRAKKAINNMNELKRLGIDVDYHAVDVNSPDSVSKALKKYRKIDGVIHAAGMEESQFIEKMTLESFSRVFNVKAYGSLNLLAALTKIDYSFFIAFSSVSARFGNEGQVNYSGGNEMLAKVLLRERAAHKKRVYKICDWTAWEGAGMATNETVNKVLKERGMTFLPLAEGIDLFMDELSDTKTVEAIFTGPDRSFDRDGILPGGAVTDGNSIAPFLDAKIGTNGKKLTFVRTLDLKRDLFISDHAKDGIPLFLGATGIETMAEAALQLAGRDRTLRELRDFQIPYSIKILKGRPKEIIIDAVKENPSGDSIKCRITSLFKNPKGVVVGDPTLHYEGTYLFSGESKQPVIQVPSKSSVEVDGDFQQIIYHPERLFMDGVFRTVQGIHSFNNDLLVCPLRHAPEREFFAGITSPGFITDVVLIDAMFQTGGIFEMLTTSDIILPSRINRMMFYKQPEKDKEYLCFTRKIASGVEANTFTLMLADYDGNVYIEIDRFDMVKVTRVPVEDRIDKMFRITE